MRRSVLALVPLLLAVAGCGAGDGDKAWCVQLLEAEKARTDANSAWQVTQSPDDARATLAANDRIIRLIHDANPTDNELADEVAAAREASPGGVLDYTDIAATAEFRTAIQPVLRTCTRL